MELSDVLYRLSDDQESAQKAFRTVVAGQQAENLLDFSDDTSSQEQPSGLAATQILSSTPAAANLLSGTSTNPLDDLVSIFGGMSTAGGSAGGDVAMDSLGGLSASSPPIGNASSLAGLTSPATQQPQEDLLGLL